MQIRCISLLFLFAVICIVGTLASPISNSVGEAKTNAKVKAKARARIHGVRPSDTKPQKRQIVIGVPTPPPVPRIPIKRQIIIGVPTPPPIPRIPVPYPYRSKSEPLPTGTNNPRRQARSIWASDILPNSGAEMPTQRMNQNKYAYIAHGSKQAVL